MVTSDRWWRHPVDELRIQFDEVHVWRAALDWPGAQIQRLARTLAIDELSRAERFRFAKDRDRFVVARGALRDILSRYAGVASSQLRFFQNPFGKLALGDEFGRSMLRFSLAHSHQLALYAVAWGREVGVDVEEVRTDVAFEPIADGFFAHREVVSIRELPAGMRREAFYTCWTRKEAYVKGRGEGLSIALDQFEVSVEPEASAALLSFASDPSEVSRWSLQDLTPCPGYAAALAVEGQSWRLRCWQWQMED